MAASKSVLWKLVIVCFVSNCFGQTTDEPCTTPDNEVGRCISITDCDYLKNQFTHIPKPLNNVNINVLQTYHCGYNTATLKVCCPQNTIPHQLESQSPNRFGSPVQPNLHLINQFNCGGKVQSLSQYPWMALIAYEDNDGTQKFRCGGSLINENYILTAAQCITNLKSYKLAGVRLGEYDLRTEIDCYSTRGCAPPIQDFSISHVIPHPLFNPNTIENDIGLLRLNRPANLHETVKPICLSTNQTYTNSLPGQKGIVTGWGTTESGLTSSQLLKISLPILTRNECQTRYNQKRTGMLIADTQMCAGGVPGKDSCAGDGGSPLGALNAEGIFVQHGIVSFGSRFCGIENMMLPGVYTKVTNYLDWILANIRP